MQDRNEVHVPSFSPAPAGASVWPRMTGLLTGGGASRYQARPDYFCPHLVTRGRGRVRTPHGEWQVQVGDLFALWPGTPIEYTEEPAASWAFYWLHLEGQGVEAFLHACGFGPSRGAFRARRPGAARRLFQRIHMLCGRRTPADATEVVSLLYRLVPACTSAPPAAAPGTDTQILVTRALVLIDGLPHAALGVNEVARTLGVSRVTLYRAFRACLDETPIQRIAAARLARARELLRTTDTKLAAVARSCGFRSEKYFLRCFRKAMGETPTQFRQQTRFGPRPPAPPPGAGNG